MSGPPEGAASKRKSPTPPARGTSGIIESLQMNAYTKPVGKATNLAGMRDQAVALARQVFRVFPLMANSKTPAVEGGCHQASCDPERVRRFWSEAMTDEPLDYNIGIATGDGLLVADIDTKDGKNGVGTWKGLEKEHGQAPGTFTVSTPGRGVHLYFEVPKGIYLRNSASNLGDGLDIRGDGGYVVAPSSTIDGVPYTVVGDAPIAPAPEWLIHLVSGVRPTKANAPAVDDDALDTPDAIARATSWLVNSAPLHGTYSVANRVLDFGVTIETACDLMLEHWNDNRPEPRSEEHILERLRHAAEYRHSPIGSSSADVEFDDVSAEVAQAEARVSPEPAWASPRNLWEDAAKAGAPPDMLDDLYPPLVQGWVDDEAERKGVSRGAVSTMALVMFGGSISARYQVQVRQKDTGFKNRPTVWAMAVGGPGSGKSPSQSAAMEPLKKVERERLRRYRDEMRVFNAAQKAEKSKAPPTSDDDPAKPRNRCRVLQDATAEAVVGREAQSNHGVTIALDELDSFFGSFDAYRSGKSSKDAPFYLAGKNGDPWEVSRVSRDAVSTDLHAVNIVGGIQPGVVRKVAGAMGGNGMMQRFLICRMGQSREAPDRAPDERLAAVVEKAVRTLSELEPDGATPPFRMHPEADLCRQRIVGFAREHIARGDMPVGLCGWLDKMEGEWARIALVLHLVEWAASSETLFDDAPFVIAPETAQRAERFLLGYQWEQQRFFYERVIGEGAAPSNAARKIADHILAHERREIANRDIITGVRSIEDRFERAAAMVALELAGWVRPIPSLKGGAAIRWSINPAVHELFSGRAVEEAQRKFAARNAILETGAERRAAAMAGA